jgi:hypothetical protein
MKFRGTIIALAAALGLVGYVLWSEQRERRQSEERASLARLVSIERDALTTLLFSHSGRRITLENRSGKWVVSRPIMAACDPRTIVTFLDTLEAARVEDNVGSGNLTRYGLDAPAAQVEIVGPGETTHRLRFGRINPLQTLVYVMVDDSEDVVLTTSSLLSYALRSDFGWRDKRMIDVDPSRIARMRFRAGNAGSLSVHRDSVGLWRSERGFPWRTDPVKTRDVLLKLASLEAVAVTAENKRDANKFGLGNRRFSAVLEYEGGRMAGDLVLGTARGEGSYHAIVPQKPEIFRVHSDVVTAMVEFTRDPRDRRLFPSFNPDDVRHIEVASPTDRFVVERRSRTRWVVASSQKQDSTFAIDPGKILGTLETMATLVVAGFPKAQPDSSLYEPPELVVTLYGADGILSGLRVGRKDPNGLNSFASGIWDQAVTLVSPLTLIELPFDLDRLGTDEIEVPVDIDRGD